MIDGLSAIDRLRSIMQRLRDPVIGCPWDVEQSMQSLIKHTLEEAYEVADAIYRNDPQHICEELGDLLFQIIFYAQIASEQGQFDFDDVASAICDKLIRRHPHVFAKSAEKMTAEDVALQWQKIKQAEKANNHQSNENQSIFTNLPNGKPALMRAFDLQKACARVGFDWHHVEPVMAKVREEIGELQAEMSDRNSTFAKREEEFGDTLFAMVNLARHLGIDADTALQKANLKFETRFRSVEKQAQSANVAIQAMGLEDLEALWLVAKEDEKKRSK